MAEEPKENKVSRPYSLKPVNIAWLTKKAGDETVARGTYVSASALLDLLIDTARLAEEAKSGEARRMKKSRWN